VTVVNTGGISTLGLVSAPKGSVSMTANSPLTVGSAGILASGDITLVASNLTSNGNMLLNGPVVSSAGAVALNAANTYTQNSAVSAALGVAASAGVGPMVFGPSATTVGSPVSYQAAGAAVTPPPSLVAPPATTAVAIVSALDQIAAVMVAQDFVGAAAPLDASQPGAGEPATEQADPLAAHKKDKDEVVVEGQTCKR